QDPLGYINGANTYQFVDSSPVGNVDAAGLAAAVHLSAGGMERLKVAVIDELSHIGSPSIDGWKPRPAAIYVAEAMRSSLAASQVFNEGTNLVSSWGTAKFVGGEWTGARIAKRVGKRDIKELAHRPKTSGAASKQTLYDTWYGEVDNEANGRKEHIYATMIIDYYPSTGTFTVGIMGFVGEVRAPGVAAASCRFHGFFYKYRGAVQTKAYSAILGLFHWTTVRYSAPIAPGSWQRIE
ncbi:MAG: hypothetical protein ACP5O7_13005, partial [Phycisphaerae bacterium]